jgi:hypothetical protein
MGEKGLSVMQDFPYVPLDVLPVRTQIQSMQILSPTIKKNNLEQKNM